MLKSGDEAPDFAVNDADGNLVKLADFRGQRVALYFYPKDDTPGCTKQACSLRDGYAKFEENGIKLLGASLDSEKSHRKFREKYNLPFTLLSDPEHKLADAYGVYAEKSFMGKKFMGTNRHTFLIDETGRIARVMDKVDVNAHADEIIAAFDEVKT